MFVKEITFALSRSTPLQSITGNLGDQYANIKPYASVTVAFTEQDHLDDDQAIHAAFDVAQDLVFTKIAEFDNELKETLWTKG